jgi:hypothetical protein
MIAVSQSVDDIFRGSHDSEKSENDNANASSVDEGHFGSVCTLHQGRISRGQLVNTGGAVLSREGSTSWSQAKPHAFQRVCTQIVRG